MATTTTKRSNRSRDSAEVRAERARRTTDVLQRAARAEGRERQALLNQAITLNLPVARSLAARYRNRGQTQEDLEQVAYLALTRAVHGFDPERGHNFMVFAVPTIQGELKRHFRDSAWTVRPPRRIQEMQSALAEAREQLTQDLGRSPTSSELAERLDCSTDEVIEALSCDGCFSPSSLDDRGPGADGFSLADTLGADEDGFDQAEAIAMLAPICRELKPRDQRIVFLRFYKGWTQEQIAQDLGVTQMQVSRLLSRILSTLRERLTADGSAPRPAMARTA